MTVAGYFSLTFIMVAVFLFIFSRATQSKKWIFLFIGGFAIWSIYLFLLGQFDVLRVMTLPPRMPMLVILPAFLLIIFTVGSSHFGKLLERIPRHQIIYAQSFRVAVELLIFQSFVEGLLPERVTFDGINFDILVGATALIIGFLAQKNMIGKKIILGWNILGLGILSVTVYSFLSYFYFMPHDPSVNVLAIMQLPFMYLPGFLMPLAVFFHMISIKQNL